MSLKLYDKAMEKKLKSVFPNVKGAAPDEAFSASQTDGKVKLPLISFYRLSNPISQSVNTAEVFRGRLIRYRSEEEAIKAMTLPMLLTYQVDIWATKREQVDDIFREVAMFFVRKPSLTIEIPNYEEPLDFSLSLTDTENSSEITDFSNVGRLYRCTLTYEVDAKLFYESDVNLVKNLDIQTYSLNN